MEKDAFDEFAAAFMKHVEEVHYDADRTRHLIAALSKFRVLAEQMAPQLLEDIDRWLKE